jgi:hypothetical protein
MRVLDVSAGNRAIWWDASEAVFVDIRESVRPQIVADSRLLPFRDGYGFDLIVFDPPHANYGKNSNFSKSYGHHTAAEIESIIRGTAMESSRVAAPRALMAFKWNDHDKKINKVLPLLEPWWMPLFGSKVTSRLKHQSMTYWTMLKRANAENIRNS